jgi:hypothetical protein
VFGRVNLSLKALKARCQFDYVFTVGRVSNHRIVIALKDFFFSGLVEFLR